MFREIRDYFVIRKSGFFDPFFYLTQNPDVKLADINPLIHFVKHGWKENRDPSLEFSVSYYLSQYQDVVDARINPLVHYLEFGKKEGRNPNRNVKNPSTEMRNDLGVTGGKYSHKYNYKNNNIPINPNSAFLDTNTINNLEPIPTSAVADIIICVGPNHAMFEACLASLKKFTDPEKYCLHIVIHEKDLPKISELITNDIKIHTHRMELFNYSKANNLVLKGSTRDVILLNDDTEVSFGWLEKLQGASKGVGLTGAHTGSHCSGNPQMWGEGPILVTNYPINMFCALIPYRLRQVVGLLDEEFVYYGGEDVDYSIRTLLHGFPLVISDAYVVHKNNQSFGRAKEILMKESDKIILEKYGLTSPFDLTGITPKVSVIMATRNRPALLEKAVESIQKVEYDNFELIIVDDASSHDTNGMVLKLQDVYPNIVSIRIPVNGGMAKARTIALRAAKGQFVLFSDDDDTVLPNRILKPLEFIIQHPILDVVYCGYNLVTSPTVSIPTYCRSFNRSEYLKLKFNIGSGILLGRKKAFIDVPFQSRYDHASDYDWVFRLIRRGFRIDYCPEIVMNYNRIGPIEDHLAGTPTAVNQHDEVYKREMLLQEQYRHN